MKEHYNSFFDTDDRNILEKNEKFIKKIETDLKNSNEVLIGTWFNNYFSFIDKYEQYIKFSSLYNFLFNLFDGRFLDKYEKFKNRDEKISFDVINISSNKCNDFNSDKEKAINNLLNDYSLNFKNNSLYYNSLEISKKELIDIYSDRIKTKLLRSKGNNLISKYKYDRYISMLLNALEEYEKGMRK